GGNASGQPEALRGDQPDRAGAGAVSGLLRQAGRGARAADRRAEERAFGGPAFLVWLLRQRLEAAGGPDGVRAGGAVPRGVRGSGGGGQCGHPDAAKSVMEGARGSETRGAVGAGEPAESMGRPCRLGTNAPGGGATHRAGATGGRAARNAAGDVKTAAATSAASQ